MCTYIHMRQENLRTYCNTLQHTTMHYNTLQRIATHCNTLQHTATHCNTLQHTYACIYIYAAGGYTGIFGYANLCGSVLRCVAVCCSVLQFVAYVAGGCTQCHNAFICVINPNHIFIYVTELNHTFIHVTELNHTFIYTTELNHTFMHVTNGCDAESICTFMNVNVYVCICTNIRTHMCTYTCVHTCIHESTNAYVYMSGRRTSARQHRWWSSGGNCYSNTLQHTATHCNTLQHAATHCNTLQHTATHCNALQQLLQHTAGGRTRGSSGGTVVRVHSVLSLHLCCV